MVFNPTLMAKLEAARIAASPELRAQLAATREANKVKSQAYIANRPRVANISNNTALPVEDLTKWGRRNIGNVDPIDVVQTIKMFGNQTPEQNVGVYNLAQPQPQEIVKQSSNYYEKTDGENQFFKPYAIGWDSSPIPNQQGSLPFLKSNLSNPRYSDATMTGIDKVLVNGEYKNIAWVNQGKNNGGVQPYIFDEARRPTIHLSQVLSPEHYQEVMSSANVPKYISSTAPFTRFLKTNPDLSNYKITDSDKTGTFKRVQTKNIVGGESILPNQGEMWGLGQELNDINKAQEQALRISASDLINVYRGSNEEPGLHEINAVANRGGSGTWVNDIVEPYLNSFRPTNETRSAGMTADDLARGGTQGKGRFIVNPENPSQLQWVAGGTDALPDLTQEDFISDRIGYSHAGYVQDTGGTRYIPKGVANLVPASEFLEPAAQWKFQPQRETLRFPTTAETPLTLDTVNEFGSPLYPGNPDNAYYFPVENNKQLYPGRRIASLSVQRNNGTLDPTQMSSRGRWAGGGIAPGMTHSKDRTESPYNPLDSYYHIKMPKNGEYLRLRFDTDPLTQEAIAADIAARDAAANYEETPQVNPFTRQYQITETGNEIPGVIPSGQIQGVTLPVMVEEKIPGGTKFEPDYMPYAPSLAPINQPIGDGLTLLDQHLADVKIEIDGAKYPLTPEATTTEYLPSAKQLSVEKTQLHNRTRVDSDDNVFWTQDKPSDVELAAIANDSKLEFNPAEDIRQLRKSGTGLSLAYADPSIAPIDIVSAIDAKKQELNRINALIANYTGVSVPRSEQEIDAIKNAYPKLTGKERTYAIGETVPIDKIYYPPSPTANSPVYQDNNFIGSIVTVTDRDGNVTQRPVSSFNKQQKVTDIDGNTYVTDVNTERVNQKDLADIFDAPRAMTVPELRQRGAYLQKEIGNASNATSQLMGMEGAPEIQITTDTGKRRAANLAEQMEQIGLIVKNNDQGQVVATGSLPIGLPSERSANLPVKYNSQEVIDPEIQALVEQGRNDTLAAQKLIDFNNQYRQERRINEIGLPSKPQLIDEAQANAMQLRLIHKAALQAKADRVAGYYGDQLADMLTTPPADTAARRVFNASRVGTGRDVRILYGENKVRNGDDFILNAGDVYPGAVHIDFQPGQSSFYDELFASQYATPNNLLSSKPLQRPRSQQNHDANYLVQASPSNIRYASPQKEQYIPSQIAPTPTGLLEPQYVTANNFNAQRSIPNTQYQLPNWTLPAAGGVYLAAAGVNEYQRQQEQKRKQEEAAVRKLYMG